MITFPLLTSVDYLKLVSIYYCIYLKRKHIIYLLSIILLDIMPEIIESQFICLWIYLTYFNTVQNVFKIIMNYKTNKAQTIIFLKKVYTFSKTEMTLTVQINYFTSFIISQNYEIGKEN